MQLNTYSVYLRIRRIYVFITPLMKKGSLVHIIGKLRRFYLYHFRKDYVQRQLSIRAGRCNQCGACCSLLFRCPMLTEDGRCRSYDHYRWAVCRAFPIDQRDIEDVNAIGGECGYCFEGDGNIRN